MVAYYSKVLAVLLIGNVLLSKSPASIYPTKILFPKFPISEASQGINGLVRIKVLVGPKGIPIKITPVEGEPGLASASVRTIQKWEFNRQGTIVISILFKLVSIEDMQKNESNAYGTYQFPASFTMTELVMPPYPNVVDKN